MGSNGFGVDHWNNDAGIGDLSREASIATHDPTDSRTDLFRVLKGMDQVGTDIALQVTAADRENKDKVSFTQSAAFEPISVACVPPIIINTRRQFRDIVSWCIALDPGNLAKVVHGMRGVPSTATYAKKEDSTVPLAGLHK